MSHDLAILLSTYNGEKFLLEQLNSLENQSYKNFTLYIRDDGSCDSTRNILEEFISQSSLRIVLLDADTNSGVIKSFEILLLFSMQNKSHLYFMFCDQDDVWLQEKVAMSYKKIKILQEQQKSKKSILVYTDLQVVDENLHILSDSFWKHFHLNPAKNCINSLAMQCNITGCTMIFNRELAQLSLPFVKESIMHDHWIGLVASAFGEIDYLTNSTIAYRQHASNVSGGAPKFNLSYISKKALKYFQKDEFHEVLGRQILQAKAFLHAYETDLAQENRDILNAIIALENASKIQRIKLLMRYKLYKHGFIRNIGLILWLIK